MWSPYSARLGYEETIVLPEGVHYEQDGRCVAIEWSGDSGSQNTTKQLRMTPGRAEELAEDLLQRAADARAQQEE